MQRFALGLAATLTLIGPLESARLAAEVESREIACSATFARRDFEAFVSFISPEAVFFAPNEPLRGRDAIGRAWQALFEGPSASFSWSPDLVQVLDSGALALTSGPVRDPSGAEVGRFSSIWLRGADGVWRVVFDKGS
jgi:ketosteroid isomerase-like protein